MKTIQHLKHLQSKHLIFVGLAFIGLGYLCLNQPPADGFLSLTLAPVLLVLGYGVWVPLALLRVGQTTPRSRQP